MSLDESIFKNNKIDRVKSSSSWQNTVIVLSPIWNWLQVFLKSKSKAISKTQWLLIATKSSP